MTEKNTNSGYPSWQCRHGKKPELCGECLDIRKSKGTAAERCSKHPDYFAANCFACKRDVDTARIHEEAAAARASLTRPATDLKIAKQIEDLQVWLGKKNQPEPESDGEVLPLRKFYQPLPKGSESSWPAHVDGMSPRNIAMLLMMPEFIYHGYEQNKMNPPKQMFITAKESFNRPAYKLPEKSERSSVQTQEQAEEWTIAPVGSEIQEREQPLVIRVDIAPPKTIRRKIPAPPELVNELTNAEGIELEQLTEEWNREHGNLTSNELASARTRQYRKIKRLKKEVAKYDRVQFVPVPKVQWDIVIPPCPERCERLYPRAAIEKYIRDAFSETDYELWDDWNYAPIENRVIKQMHVMNLFRGWPNNRAWAQWLFDGKPAFGSPIFDDFYGWPKGWDKEVKKPSSEYGSQTATENALSGYRRATDGSVADESIRRVGPGTGGGWLGARRGHGPE